LVLKSSNHEFPHTDKGQKCEAYYHMGMAHLLGLQKKNSFSSDTTKAKQFLQKSLDTGIMDYLEYEMANSELKKMKEEE